MVKASDKRSIVKARSSKPGNRHQHLQNLLDVIGQDGKPKLDRRSSVASPDLSEVRNTYSSAGYDVFGITSDGVIIIRPEGTPDSFKLPDLRKAVSDLRSAKARRSS